MLTEGQKIGMPKFLGIGSAFNTNLGNTSCYIYKEDCNRLTLIDCGWDVFKKLKDNGILNDKPDIYIYITHLHGDHIGSLSSLIEYNFYVNNKTTRLFYNNETALKQILSLMLVNPKLYEICESRDYYLTPHIINNIDVNDNSNVHTLESENNIFIFSWDSAGISKNIYNRFIKDSQSSKLLYNANRAYLFHDCCLANYPGNVHTYYKLLLDLVPEELRANVFPVHIDDEKVLDIMIEAGFGDVRELLS